MLGYVCWVLGFVFWVLGIVSWVLGIVFWVLGFVFWVSGSVFRVSGIVFWVLGFVFWVCCDVRHSWWKQLQQTCKRWSRDTKDMLVLVSLVKASFFVVMSQTDLL